MERPEKNQDASKEPEKNKISTKDLFGFLAWYEDPAASRREKRLLKKRIDTAVDERGKIVEEEFEKMVAEDPSLRAAFELLPKEMALSASQVEATELVGELQKSPEQFWPYIQWLNDIFHTIDEKRFSADDFKGFENIRNKLSAIGKAEQMGSLNKRDIIAMKISCIQQMKKILRQSGVQDDLLTKEAFQKWSQSKSRPGAGGGHYIP